jgi:hypothetical protein
VCYKAKNFILYALLLVFLPEFRTHSIVFKKSSQNVNHSTQRKTQQVMPVDEWCDPESGCSFPGVKDDPQMNGASVAALLFAAEAAVEVWKRLWRHRRPERSRTRTLKLHRIILLGTAPAERILFIRTSPRLPACHGTASTSHGSLTHRTSLIGTASH